MSPNSESSVPPRIVAVVPARAGSKGLPGKNLAVLGGRTLLARAIDVAAAVASIDRVVVSSDSDSILKEAERCGADPLRRPIELASDESTTADALQHALAVLPDTIETVVVVQPTSPLRVVADVERALASFDGIHPVATLVLAGHPVEWSFRMGADGALDPVLGWSSITRRQDSAPVYRLNGAVFVVAASDVRAGLPIVRPGVVGVVMPVSRSVDIDTPDDLARAEQLLAPTDEVG